jgi:GNAT superfamily N-acetyltransferase
VKRDGGAADEVRLRLLAPSDDIAELTALLHRAYAGLAQRGMRFLASHQDEVRTLRRISAGECWLAVAGSGGTIVGTIVLKNAERTSGSPWYDRPAVACFGQFAVKPEWQGRGVGSRLVDQVERRARAKGITELALDTAEGAEDLRRFYERRGYRFVEYAQWTEVNYRSVIMTKSLRQIG